MPNINQKPRDENGDQHGEWIGYWDNGQLWYLSNWSHGMAHGLCEGYDRYGKLDYRGYYSMNKKIGYWYWDTQKSYYLSLI